PSTGTLAYLGLPAHAAFANGDVRVDGGVRTGDTISPHYDPMIAKIIVRGADRAHARARTLPALAHAPVAGAHTHAALRAPPACTPTPPSWPAWCATRPSPTPTWIPA